MNADGYEAISMWDIELSILSMNIIGQMNSPIL